MKITALNVPSGEVRRCSIEGCASVHYGQGFCNKHYKRFRTHGDPLMDARAQRTPVVDRFWPKVAKSDGCWEWTGSRDKKGYGFIGTGGKVGNAYAHRVSFELANEEIPAGMHILHSCDNPSCVRPDHLSLGTHADNMRDMSQKGRASKHSSERVGELNGNHRLTADQVMAIRQRVADGASRKQLARELGVSKTLISLIQKGVTWKHLLEAKS